MGISPRKRVITLSLLTLVLGGVFAFVQSLATGDSEAWASQTLEHLFDRIGYREKKRIPLPGEETKTTTELFDQYHDSPALIELQQDPHLPFSRDEDIVASCERPAVPMPLATQAFKSVELSIDSQIVSAGPIHLKSGGPVRVRASIRKGDNLPSWYYPKSGVLGIAYRANNEVGWAIQVYYLDNNVYGVDFTILGTWKVPQISGDAFLLVLASMPDDGSTNLTHFRIAAAYPVRFE